MVLDKREQQEWLFEIILQRFRSESVMIRLVQANLYKGTWSLINKSMGTEAKFVDDYEPWVFAIRGTKEYCENILAQLEDSEELRKHISESFGNKQLRALPIYVRSKMREGLAKAKISGIDGMKTALACFDISLTFRIVEAPR